MRGATLRLYEGAVSVEHQVCVEQREAVFGTVRLRTGRTRLPLDVVGHDVHPVSSGQAAEARYHLKQQVIHRTTESNIEGDSPTVVSEIHTL